MIESFIAGIIGPFVLFGIIIVAFGMITGVRTERLLNAYARFCFHLFSSLAIPTFKALSHAAIWFGDKLNYVLDSHHSVGVNDFTVKATAPQNTSSSSTASAAKPTQNGQTSNPNDDAVDVEIIS